MASEKKRRIVVFLLVLLAGAGMHFLYHLLPILPIAVIAPVDESLFQHLKLLFWPLVLGAFYLRTVTGNSMRPHLLGLLISSALMLAVGWLYHITLGGEALWVDLVLYVVLVVVEFAVPRFCPAKPAGRLWDTVAFLSILLAVLLVLFTFLPPDHLLFVDLSGANTWAVLPC